MPLPLTPRDGTDFSIAIICALEVESDAVELLFDHIWDANGDRYGKAPGDPNSYRTGVIGNHNVVLAYMTGMGKVQAASVAKSCRWSFPGIRLALIVGVCGGVPGSIEGGIFLGDIVISDEILPYDFVKQFPGTFQYREAVSRSSGDNEGREHLLSRTAHHLDVLRARTREYTCPPRQSDQLFEPSYHHQHHDASKCKTCAKGKSCRRAQKATCKALKCDQERLILRLRPFQGEFNIHFGRIASGDTVMKSGRDRDRIADKEKVIAFEMEGAGIDGIMPFLVIKGVCDYADSHKNKVWQKYSAGAAASCMKSLLEQWAVIDQAEERHSLQESLRPSHETASEECALSTRRDEGYHSQYNPDTNDEELLEATVLPEIDSSFKCCLPRDADLKEVLKTQRFLVSDHAKVLLSDDYFDSSGLFYLEIALEIRKKLEGIKDLIRQLPVATQTRAQPIKAVSSLKVKDLVSLVQNFRSVINHAKKPHARQRSRRDKSPECCRKFEDFRVIQRAAHSLYDAVGTACAAHTVHNVHISLQPTIDSTTTRVRFNVALIQHSRAPRNAVWVDVESSIKSDESYSQLRLTSSASDNPSLTRRREVDRGDCSSAQRKRVQFKLPSEPIQPLRSKSDVVEIPHLHIQRNFCKVIERFSNQQEPKSLSELISQTRSDLTKEMSQYERVRLAKYLATAVLYYHGTPWLNRAWRSEDIHFFDDPDPSIKRPQHVLAYMTSSVSMEAQSAAPTYHHFIRNPVLFGLGVMFLEPQLSHGKISKSFKEVTKRCLYCDFGHDSDFNSPARLVGPFRANGSTHCLGALEAAS
ncbi:hypothetical protein BDW75DRAFT_248950 [Aspergillus navahoensis]